jgi:hypothetical protein
MRSAASDALPRRSRVPPLDWRFNAAEPTYCQLDPAGPAERCRLARTNEDWFLTPRHRLDRTVRVKR